MITSFYILLKKKSFHFFFGYNISNTNAPHHFVNIIITFEVMCGSNIKPTTPRNENLLSNFCVRFYSPLIVAYHVYYHRSKLWLAFSLSLSLTIMLLDFFFLKREYWDVFKYLAISLCVYDSPVPRILSYYREEFLGSGSKMLISCFELRISWILRGLMNH